MRKFFVTYSVYTWKDHDIFSNIIVTLSEGEKANLSTFENKLKYQVPILKQIISWSLIEE